MEESDKAPPQPQPQPQQVGGEPMNMSMAVATADLMANIVAAPQPISTTTSEEATTTSKPPAAAAAAAKPAKSSKSTKAYEKKWLENLELLKPCIKADGTIDYASLDEEVQKRMRSFVKDQRKCYRKRENNEATPMTDERYRLLSEAKFNFKPSESNKARSQDKKKKKKSSSPSVLANLGDSTPAKGKTFDSVEKAELSSSKKPLSSGKKLTPMKTDDLSADSKMPAKKSPKSSSSKSSSPPAGRKKSGKPTYLEMTHNAIVALKDRSGSSNIAIGKWVLANNEHCKSVPPNMFKSRLNQAIKAGVKEGRFAKVKNSYKISSEWNKKQKAASRAKDASRKKAEKARTAELEKSKQKKKEQSDEEERKRKEKDMTPEQREAAKKKRQARKKQAEADKKELEWFRKKRFPMEDLELHRIEKKHGIKAPKHLTKQPALPHTLTCLVPPHLRKNTPKQYQGAVARASKSGNGELMGGNNDRGLVADAITVFQFFCGDVGLEDADHPVPKFSLKTLFYALDEVQNGNAKAAKSLPPLLTHLFVTALRLVTAPKQTNGDDEDDVDLDPVDVRLEEDLQLLRKGLNPVSWSQICFFYMDLMERYYTSDETLEDGVLPGDDKLDMTYYWNNDKMDIDDVEAKESDVRPLSATYTAYLGNADCVLYKGYEKLMRQVEPWNLKADELMALLRALTDDVMSKRPDLAEDIAGRAAKLQELTKVKRNALIKYNRVRLQYEGPKKPVRQKKAAGDEDDKGDKKKDDEEEADADSKEEGKPFVPTATKKQFETAEKAYFRALEALDKGLTKLIARSEPIAFDRNHNAIYFFQHDPTMLHVETLTTRESTIPPEIKKLGVEYTPASVWHFIDTKSLFEQYVGSMDRRGTREREALEVCNDLTLLKRKLQDDKESNSRELARKKEKEDLERRLENAKSACDAEDGRRSGRLVGLAQGELKAVEEEIKELAKAHEEEERQEKIGRDNASDYSLLTGLQTLTELYGGQRSTRSNRKSDNIVQTDVELLANAPCHKLWVDERIGGNGTLNILVEALFALEKKCNDLSPWSRQDITREAWRKQLSDASFAWAIDCEMQLGPLADNKKSSSEGSNSTSPSPAKKRKVDPAASKESLNKIITTVKLCLKDLEWRVFEMSGKKRLLEEEYTAEEENENLSEEEDNEELIKRRNNWKVKINALKQVPVHRYALIRDVIVAAITVARKSHLNNVAAELKTALQMIRDHSGGEAKYAALKILDKYGGYEGDDDEDEDFDALAAVGGDAPNTNEEEDVVVATMLADEFNWVSGSIGGEGDVDGSEWSKAIKECKSVSRLAALIQSFLSKADVCLENLKEDNDRLLHVLRSKTALKKHDSANSIWCNVEVTTQLVKAKVTDYPWWPAHRCIPLDSSVKDALEGSGYVIVASVGNENASLFLVAEKEIVDFSSEPEDDLSQYDESVVQGMEEAMGMAKNLWKARNRGVASPWRTKKRPSPRLSDDESAEEKKEE